MTLDAAVKALRDAVTGGAVYFTSHADERMADAGLSRVFVLLELERAADRGAISLNRNHAGRYVAFGNAVIASFEVVAPAVVVVTVFLNEG